MAKFVGLDIFDGLVFNEPTVCFIFFLLLFKIKEPPASHARLVSEARELSLQKSDLARELF